MKYIPSNDVEHIHSSFCGMVQLVSLAPAEAHPEGGVFCFLGIYDFGNGVLGAIWDIWGMLWLRSRKRGESLKNLQSNGLDAGGKKEWLGVVMVEGTCILTVFSYTAVSLALRMR